MNSPKRHKVTWRNKSLATGGNKNEALLLQLPGLPSSPITKSPCSLANIAKYKESSPKLLKVEGVKDVDLIIEKTNDIFTCINSNKQTKEQFKFEAEKNRLLIGNQKVQIRGGYVDDLMDRIRLQDIIKKLQSKVVHRSNRIYNTSNVDVLLKTSPNIKKNLVNTSEIEIFDQDVRVKGIQKYTEKIKMQLQDEQTYTSKREKQNEILQSILCKTTKLTQIKEELLLSMKRREHCHSIKLIEAYPEVISEHYAV